MAQSAPGPRHGAGDLRLGHVSHRPRQGVQVLTLLPFSAALVCRRGWCEDCPALLDSVRRGWAGLATTVLQDGTIAGIIGGTGVQVSSLEHSHRSQLHCAGHGRAVHAAQHGVQRGEPGRGGRPVRARRDAPASARTYMYNLVKK